VTIPGASEVLEANQGGNILLLEGSYQIAGAIDVSGRSNVTIEGIGPATVIYNTATDGSHAIQAINTGAPKNRIVVRNLTVVGNALSGDGIHLAEIAYPTVQDVYALSNGGNGICIYGSTPSGPCAENKIISNVQCLYNKLDGLHLESANPSGDASVHETLIVNSHFEENYRYNIGLSNVIDTHIDNCSIEDCHGTYEIFTTNNRNNQLDISNTVIEGEVMLSGEIAQFSNIRQGGVNGAGFTISTSALTSLKITNSLAALADGEFNWLLVTNSYLYLRGAISVSQDACFTGSYVYAPIVTPMASISIAGAMTFSGGNLNTEAGFSLLFSATNSRITVVGSNLTSFRGTIGKAGSPTGTRLLFNSNNVRTSTFTIDGIDMIKVCDNLLVGAGSITLSNVAGIVQIDSNILSNFPITLDSTCSPSTKQFLNNLGGTVTDNSV
jgi:hypothetical protein